MARIVWILITCQLALQCKSPEPQNTASNSDTPQTEIAVENTSLDTIFIDLAAPYLSDLERGNRWLQLDKRQLVDSLLSIADTTGLLAFKDSQEIYPAYPDMSQFTDYNIPLPVYGVMTNTKVPIEKMYIKKGNDCQSKDNLVYCNYGMKYYHERDHISLYQGVLKDQFALLFLTKQGKYAPDVFASILDFNSFRLTDSKMIYGGIHDAGDVNVTTSEFSQNYDTLTIYTYKNDGNWGAIDTASTSYVIGEKGMFISEPL